MVEQTIIVKNKIGIHSRPAALLVDTAGKYTSKVTVINGEKEATAASLTKILALRVKMGNEIRIRAEGEDENEALVALTALIDSKFGED